MLQKHLANFNGTITFILKCLENLNCMENMNNTVLRADKYLIPFSFFVLYPLLLTGKAKYKDQRQKCNLGVYSQSSAHHVQRFFIKQLLSTNITKSKFTPCSDSTLQGTSQATVFT